MRSRRPQSRTSRPAPISWWCGIFRLSCVTKTVTILPDGRLVEQLSLFAPERNDFAFKVMGNSRFGSNTLVDSVDIQPLVEHQL